MQALVASGIATHYWAGKNTAYEVEFLFSNDVGQLAPIEVRSDSNLRARSLKVFLEKSQAPYGVRLSTKNFGLEERISVFLFVLRFVSVEVLCKKPEE